VVWKTEIPGEGWSSPVLYRDKLFLTAAVPQGEEGAADYSLRVLAIDPNTGENLWNVEVFRQEAEDAPRIHRKNSHASPTPIAAGDRLYVHFGHQGTACLDLQGNVVWRQTSLSYRPVHGNGGSPILVDGRLVFSIDGAEQTKVVALDAETGQVAWQTDRGSTATKKFSFSTPLAIEVAGRTQVISPGSDMVCAYDAASGAEIWRVLYDGYSVIPRPVFGHGLVFVCTGYNRPSLMAIDPRGEGDVTDSHVRWTTKKSVPHTPSLLLVEDELYMVSDRGIASCLDARTGEVHWTDRVDGNYSASPLYADGHIYLQNEQGLATVLRAGKEFEKLATNSLEERTLASYAVADSALFIRTAGHLYRIEK
jgi:outer membrane protein assembly factor BamB